MSETVRSGTSILLPGAQVSVFSHDRETLETARALGGDWRFARVGVSAQEGDVDTAIALYQGQASPDLVIVQTDQIDESFTQKLETLAGSCAERTAAIVVGPVNDVYLYRRLIGMGVSDYLVRPLNPQIFAEVIAKTIIEKIGATGSRLIAVAGAKGGVGASILAEILASGIADILKEKAVLIDAGGGWSTASVGLGFEPATTLGEALRMAMTGDEARLSRALIPFGDRLSVLASGGDVMLEHNVAPEHVETLLNVLMARHPLLVFDLSGAPPLVRRAVLARAHKVVVVSTASLSSLRLARTMMHEIRDLRGGSAGDADLVVNMSGIAPSAEVPRGDIEAALECRPALFVPFNPKLFMGLEGHGKKFTDDKAGAEIAKSLLPLVQKLLSREGDSPPDRNKPDGGVGGILGLLRKG